MTAKARMLAACGHALEPLIRLLLKSGVTWRELAELTKEKFVQVATNEFGIRGRPTNASRVAILTGLDRREVRTLRDAAQNAAAGSPGYVSKPTLLLGGWHHDPDFLESDGTPRELERDGEGATFSELVRRYSPGIPPVALIKELTSAGAVTEVNGRLRVLKRVYLPKQLDEAQVRLWGSIVHDIGVTLEHNLTHPDMTPVRFERRALSVRVDEDSIPAFREFLEREGQEFLERVDDWLSAHEISQRATSDERHRAVRLGAGIYHIEDQRPRRARA
jgi:hypothetical protein